MNNRKLFPSLLTLPVLVALIVGCNGMSTTMPTVTTSAAPSKFMYIALLTPDGIGALRIHGDGSLNPLTNAPFPAPPGPDRIVASEQFIFIAGFGTVDALGFCCQNQTIATYKQDQVTGSLTQVASMRHDSLDALSGFALDPAGRFLYAGNENGSGGLDVFAVAQDGHLAQAGGFDPRLGGLFGPVFHPNGQFLYVAGGSGIYRFEINPETGMPIDTQKIDTLAVLGLRLSPDGKFLLGSADGVSGYQLCSFKLDPVTGLPPMIDPAVAHQPIPTACIPTGTSSGQIGFHPAGRFLALSQRNSGPGDALPGSVAVYRFDAGNLTAVTGASFVTGMNTQTPTFSGDGKFLFVLANQARSTFVNVFAFDKETGAITPVPGSPVDIGFAATIFLR